MKTIFIYNDTATHLQFFIKKGDYSHLNNCYINSENTSDKDWDEINSLIFSVDEDGSFVSNPDTKMLDMFPTDQIDVNTKVVVIGFYA